MSWMKSILIGIVNVPLAAIAAWGVAMLCVEWFRMSSFEGQSGYFVVFMGLLGAVAGFFVGVIAARIVAAGPDPGFLKGLGYAVGSTVGIAAIFAASGWLSADFPPKIDGKLLTMEFEARFPAGSVIPPEGESQEVWSVFLSEDHGKRKQWSNPLRRSEARRVDGCWIIPASVDLETTDYGKSLGISLGPKPVQYYQLPPMAKPTRNDMNWSDWMPGPTFGELDKIPPQERLGLRYRVQFR